MENLKFGELTVISRCGSNKRGEKLWNCICECGNTKIVKSYNLTSGKTKSCGCLTTGPKPTTPIGEKIERLTILDKVGTSKCRTQLVECRCDCGTVFTTFLKNIQNGDTKSCGCYSKDRLKALKGELHPNYNPLLTEEDRLIGRMFDGYGTWKREVKKRDDYTCQCCKTKGGDLVSHHLDGYHWCVEKRTDVNNGVCLCKDCHKSFHKIYSMKNNTKEQFKQFIEQYEHAKNI